MTTALVQSTSRQSEVLDAILTIKASLVERSLELGALLVEAEDNEYHLQWGYPTHRSWVLDGSGLDMSESQAYALKRVVRRTRALGIPKETLLKVKLSKLKVIMSLPAETDPAKIIELVNEAETATLDTVKSVVSALSNTEHVFKTFKLPKEFAEDVYEMAVESCRRQAGSDTAEDGTVSDISESRCLELIYADFASSTGVEDMIADAEFQDNYEVEIEQVTDV